MEKIQQFIQDFKTKMRVDSIQTRIAVSFCVFVFLYYFFISAPMLSEKKVDVTEGFSLMQISSLLKKEHIIRSENVFRIVTILSSGGSSIKAGTYLFGGKENVLEVSNRLAKADYGVPVEKVTVTEGMDSHDIVRLISTKLPSLDSEKLENSTKRKEGYLFPDTYFIPLSATNDDVIKMMSSNFERKISAIDFSISKTSKDVNEILTMASIIEGEAKTDVDRKIISGILWKRINIGMPLQVDATFMYINGKASLELTKKDLSIDSPYNTYKNKGLPPTPINNPGLEAIQAAMFPTESPYLYYLSDRDGVMHYAKNFEEHKKNKEKYLK